MAKMGTITAEKAQSAVLDILRICGGPCFHCSYFLEGLVEISLLSHFKSLCRGRNAPFSPHLEFKTLSCTLPRLGIPRGRLVRDNNFSVLYTSITSLRRVLVWSLYSCWVLQFALVGLTFLSSAHNLGLHLFYLVTSSTNIVALVQVLHVERVVGTD